MSFAAEWWFRMALPSFNHLLKQVESLKSENSHLRRELQDNSSHLTKLENEASNMKDVLSHIQLTMNGKNGSSECSWSTENSGEMGDTLHQGKIVFIYAWIIWLCASYSAIMFIVLFFAFKSIVCKLILLMKSDYPSTQQELQ